MCNVWERTLARTSNAGKPVVNLDFLFHMFHGENFKAYASAADPLEQQGVGNVDAPLNLSNWFQMFGLPLLIGMFGNAGPLPEGYL